MVFTADEAGRQRALAAAHRQEAARADALARRHAAGDDGEAVVRGLLAPLQREGWRLLHKRRWPGTRRGDIDHLVVGPGGVFVLDSKNWRGDVRLVGGRLWQGDDDVSDRLQGLTDQLTAVEGALLDHGLAPLEIVGALVFVGQPIPVTSTGRGHVLGDRHLLAWLRARGQRLAPTAVHDLAEALKAAVPPLDPADAPVVPIARPRPRARSADAQQALFAVEELDLTELARASRQTLEEWMVYLHPFQLSVVRRRYEGPSRVRGPAGCGKTVVALHRAAYLAAQEPGDLLFLTFVRTLPGVLANLFARLAPQAAPRVRFAGVHRLAKDVLRDAGVRDRLDAKAAETCFSLAWVRCGREHLERDGLPLDYWREEVSKVIKGRGLDDFEDYRTLPRTGRRTPLTADQRRHVWDLYVEYENLLSERGVQDFEDVVASALEVARSGVAKRYRFVLVDEAQDLDLLSIRLAHALVSDAKDGLTLVGDGQQAIYAGGYTLKEAGIGVIGRSTVLETNYRNTREVLAAARSVVRADSFDDLEDVDESGDREIRAVRDGVPVLEVAAPDPLSLDIALLKALRDGSPHADAAVLSRTAREADRLIALLARNDVPVVDLLDYDGTPVDAVKVGTVKRAKGLEFGRVFIPRVDAYLVADGAAEPERVQRERRELFVGMTRARDELWLGQIRPAVAG
jgi:hypothetical protein